MMRAFPSRFRNVPGEASLAWRMLERHAPEGFEVNAGPMREVFDPLLLAVLGATATLLGALGHSRLVARAEAEGKDLNGLPFVVVVLGTFLLFFLATTQLQQAPSADLSQGWVLRVWSAP